MKIKRSLREIEFPLLAPAPDAEVERWWREFWGIAKRWWFGEVWRKW